MSTERPSASKGELTRLRILEALSELLGEMTYDDLTIAEVTRRAAVTRPAFYFHFDSLGAAVSSLLEGLFDEFVATAGVWYDHRLRAPDHPDDAFRQGMTGTVALWRRHARVMDAISRAAATDVAARRVLDGWISVFADKALPVAREDATHLGESVERVTRLLVLSTFDAMGRDVRSIAAGDRPDPDLADTVSRVWIRTLYG